VVKLKTPIETLDGTGKSAAIVNVRREFGTRLLRRIQQKGMNQSDLARATGLGRDSISLYCLGKALPTSENAKKLADCLDCFPGDLIPSYEVHLLDERSKGRSPIYLDPSRHPNEARINISEWLPLDIAQSIFNLWVEAQKRSQTPPPVGTKAPVNEDVA